MPAPIVANGAAEGSNREDEDLLSSTAKFAERTSRLHSSASFISRRADGSSSRAQPMLDEGGSDSAKDNATHMNPKPFSVKAGPRIPRLDLKSQTARRGSLQKMSSALNKVKTLAALGSLDDEADMVDRREKAAEMHMIETIVSVIKDGNSKIMSIFSDQELRTIVDSSATRRLTGGQLLMSQVMLFCLARTLHGANGCA